MPLAVILPIENYKLLNQAYSARRRCWCQVLRTSFRFKRWELFNQIQNCLCKRKYGVLNSERVNKYLRCNFADWQIKLNSPRGPFKVVIVIYKCFANFFSLPQIPKTVQLSTWKIQANAELTFWPSIGSTEFQYWMCPSLRCEFCRSLNGG